MKRSNIVKKLMSEGISEKTLSLMSDNQLNTLSKRILGEDTVYISKNNPKYDEEVTKAKTDKKTIETYEGEVKEETETKESARTFANQNRPNQHQSKKFKAGSPFKNNFSPVETAKTTKKFKKEETPKVKGKSKPFEKKSSKKTPKAKLAESLKTLKETEEIRKWIELLIQEKYHPMTTKNEIMEVVKQKITEQFAEPGVAEPTTRPTTKPGNPDREKKREDFPNPWDPPKENPINDPDPKFELGDLPDFLLSDEIISSLNESKIDRLTSIIISKLKKKRLDEQVFNDDGEPMMSHNQYNDYSEPSEPDHDDMNDNDQEDNDLQTLIDDLQSNDICLETYNNDEYFIRCRGNGDFTLRIKNGDYISINFNGEEYNFDSYDATLSFILNKKDEFLTYEESENAINREYRDQDSDDRNNRMERGGF